MCVRSDGIFVESAVSAFRLSIPAAGVLFAGGSLTEPTQCGIFARDEDTVLQCHVFDFHNSAEATALVKGVLPFTRAGADSDLLLSPASSAGAPSPPKPVRNN